MLPAGRNLRHIDGFTLIEMLIALVVIAVVGISISQAIGGVASQTYQLERRTVAHWVGQNQLHRMRIVRRADNSPIAEGRDTERVLMAGRNWEVRTAITGTEHPWMRRVEVEVYALEEGDRIGPISQHVAFLGQN